MLDFINGGQRPSIANVGVHLGLFETQQIIARITSDQVFKQWQCFRRIALPTVECAQHDLSISLITGSVLGDLLDYGDSAHLVAAKPDKKTERAPCPGETADDIFVHSLAE